MQFGIHIPETFTSGEKRLNGDLFVPPGASAIVIFSHGSGSSRFSPRNIFVAKVLHQSGIGTFLVDLLTKEEDKEYANRFNIALLTQRLIDGTRHLHGKSSLKKCSFGYFGASTGAASAILAAIEMGGAIKAVVSRGGRPDLALVSIPLLETPTLLITGGLDHGVIELNKRAYDMMSCKKEFVIIEGATHLFEEPGTLEKVAELASDWFREHLQPVKEISMKN